MVAFDTENGTDPNDVHTKAAAIKLPYNDKNVEFWFTMLEAKMRFAGIQSQWTKLQVVITLIPMEVAEEIQHLLRASDPTAAGTTCYKDIKAELIQLFGLSEDDVFDKVNAFVLTTTPSALAKKMADAACTDHPKLAGCCSAAMVAGLWRAKLPKEVRQAIAGQSLKTNFDVVTKHADAVYKTMGRKAAPTAAGIDEAAALAKPKGQAKKNAAKKAAAANTAGAKPKGQQKSPDNPPDGCCQRHMRYGRQTWYCLYPKSCPWADILVARPTNA